MYRCFCAFLAGLVLLMTGCAAPKPPEDPAPQVEPPAEAPPVSAPVEPTLSFPRDVSPDELAEQLYQFANAVGEDAGNRLAALYGGVMPTNYPSTVGLIEADLDLDGTPELVAAPKPNHPANGPGAVYILYRRDGRWAVERSRDAIRGAELPRTGVSLHGVADLNGDGRPEVIWSSAELVAHSPPSTVFLSNWKPGAWTETVLTTMINMDLKIEGKDLVLHGGNVGGGSSGLGQPVRTDRYRWVEGKYRLVDRQLADDRHTAGYFWLMQGVAYEDLGRPAEAAAAYRKALEPGRVPFDLYYSADPDGTAEKFGEAMRTYVRFRLGLLLQPEERATPDGPYAGLLKATAGAPDRAAGCEAASAWMAQNPEFERMLNSLIGYVHPKWTSRNPCAALHEAGGFVTPP